MERPNRRTPKQSLGIQGFSVIRWPSVPPSCPKRLSFSASIAFSYSRRSHSARRAARESSPLATAPASETAGLPSVGSAPRPVSISRRSRSCSSITLRASARPISFPALKARALSRTTSKITAHGEPSESNTSAIRWQIRGWQVWRRASGPAAAAHCSAGPETRQQAVRTRLFGRYDPATQATPEQSLLDWSGIRFGAPGAAAARETGRWTRLERRIR